MRSKNGPALQTPAPFRIPKATLPPPPFAAPIKRRQTALTEFGRMSLPAVELRTKWPFFTETRTVSVWRRCRHNTFKTCHHNTFRTRHLASLTDDLVGDTDVIQRTEYGPRRVGIDTRQDGKYRTRRMKTGTGRNRTNYAGQGSATAHRSAEEHSWQDTEQKYCSFPTELSKV